jgi:hypothetical protein
MDIDVLEPPDPPDPEPPDPEPPEPPVPGLIDYPGPELTEPRDHISIVLVQPRRDRIDHPDRIDPPDLLL